MELRPDDRRHLRRKVKPETKRKEPILRVSIQVLRLLESVLQAEEERAAESLPGKNRSVTITIPTD
jgi:hypothetical protein